LYFVQKQYGLHDACLNHDKSVTTSYPLHKSVVPLVYYGRAKIEVVLQSETNESVPSVRILINFAQHES